MRDIPYDNRDAFMTSMKANDPNFEPEILIGGQSHFSNHEVIKSYKFETGHDDQPKLSENKRHPEIEQGQ